MSEFNNETTEQQTLLQKMHRIGADALSAASQGFYENRRRVAAILSVGSAALGGGVGINVLNSTPASAESAYTSGSLGCEQYKDIMSPGQVTAAIHKPTGRSKPSLVSTALDAIKEAKPSMKYVTRVPGFSTTEADAYYTARIGSSKKLGTYVFQVNYKGKLTPKSVESVSLLEVPETFSGVYWRSPAQFVQDNYKFKMSSEDYENEGPDGFNWLVSVGYNQKKNAAGSLAIYSALGNGEEFGKPDLHLTPSILESVDYQFITLAEKAERHESMTSLAVLPELRSEIACQN